MQTTQNFLNSFWDIQDIEISNLKQVFSLEEGMNRKDENIYFLHGITKKDKRNNDHDLCKKNSFFIDFDIRKYFREKEWNEISDEEIKDIWVDLWKYLKQNPKYWFNQWRWIVFTGNGLHIHYIGDTMAVPDEITPKEYQAGVSKIYKAFYEYMGVPYFEPDWMCRNIGRVARLPWSINQKTGKIVEIIAEQEVKSILVSKIKQYWVAQLELEKEYQELLAKKYALEARQKMMEWENRKEIEAILEYPVEALLMGSWKIEIEWFANNKNFIDPRDKSYYGFYKANDGNYIVVWWSTTLAPYADGKDWLNPFDLVKWLYGLDNKGVFNFFKNKTNG